MHDLDDGPHLQEHAHEIADLYEASFGPDPEVPARVLRRA